MNVYRFDSTQSTFRRSGGTEESVLIVTSHANFDLTAVSKFVRLNVLRRR